MAETARAAKRESWALKAAMWLAAAGLAFAFIGLAPSCSRVAEPKAGIGELATGAMQRFEPAKPDAPAMPTEAFSDAKGAMKTFADFRGQVLVVNYWATWCPPCLKEMPTLAALQAAMPERVKVLAVSVDGPKQRDQAIEMLARLSAGELEFFQAKGVGLPLSVGVNVFPTTIVYDREGRERGRLEGDADWASPEAKALLEAVAGG